MAIGTGPNERRDGMKGRRSWRWRLKVKRGSGSMQEGVYALDTPGAGDVDSAGSVPAYSFQPNLTGQLFNQFHPPSILPRRLSLTVHWLQPRSR